MAKIDKLTLEQEALIAVYQEKWRSLALSTQRINHAAVKAAVETAYAAIAQPEPEILFCESPQAAEKVFTGLLKRQTSREMAWLVDHYSATQRRDKLWEVVGASLSRKLEAQIYWQLKKQLEAQLEWNVRAKLERHSQEQSSDQVLWEQLQLNQAIQEHLRHCLRLDSWLQAGWMDFAISVFNCQHEPATWSAFQTLTENCGWLFPYEQVCLVCDRPVHILFDAQGRLHAEGEPAVQFPDGLSLYAYQGVRLPEHYGRLHPHQWQAQWLLTEPNAELRRVLLQGLGYGRIFQELEAVELDSWREYTLWEIEADVDEEPILLLKMACPSTGFIHVSRVPPEVESAKEAIRWVNWEVDPEDFAVQT